MIYHNTYYLFLVWADNCNPYKKWDFILVSADLINRYKNTIFHKGCLS
jgi:hypothetical protein